MQKGKKKKKKSNVWKMICHVATERKLNTNSYIKEKKRRNNSSHSYIVASAVQSVPADNVQFQVTPQTDRQSITGQKKKKRPCRIET